MRKLMAIALICALPQVVSASKSYLSSLGLSSEGSYFADDYRNIFLNPSMIVDQKNSVLFEMGATSVASSPKAEGGFTYGLGAGVLGLHLGRRNNATTQIVTADATNGPVSTATFFNPQNSIEILYGGGRGALKYGASLHYAKSKSDVGATANLPDSEAEVNTLRLGAQQGPMAVHLSYDVKHETKTTAATGETKLEGKTGIEAGGMFMMPGGMKATLSYITRKYDFNDGSANTGNYERENLALNVMRDLKNTEKSRFFIVFGYAEDSIEVDFDATSANTIKQKATYLPLSLAVEHQVKSWMKFAASVKQNIIIDDFENIDGTGNLETANTDDTTVAIGLRVMFDDFLLEGNLAGSTTGTVDANNLLTNAALTYYY